MEMQEGSQGVREWRSRDKSAWGPGPWQSEPDKMQWRDDATGLPCLIVRGPSGALCGYVAVAPGHPMHGMGYSACPKGHNDTWGGDDICEFCKPSGWCKGRPESVVDVHGGLTFASKCFAFSREAWEQWRDRLKVRADEAQRFPRGDIARALKDAGPALDNYDAWVEQSHASHICHIAAPGEPDNVWWFGFDCAHAGDYTPDYSTRFSYRDGNDAYRDVPYVREQVAALASQLAARA